MPGADALIARFDLVPHPEGGWYRRVHASALRVETPAGKRHAVTSIIYLLRAGETSRWHRVRADEIWHYCEGAPLALHRADPALDGVATARLGPGDDAMPVIAVPADHWQAARCQGDYTLVGCTVAPGFDFADFTLLADDAALSTTLRRRHPAFAGYL